MALKLGPEFPLEPTVIVWAQGPVRFCLIKEGVTKSLYWLNMALLHEYSPNF